ncbi:MAG: aldehyde dehydrogenase family protein [Chloroflexota bacterium]
MEQSKVLPCINPATGEQFDEVEAATAQDASRALQEMRDSFQIWRRKSVRERAEILEELQLVLVERADEITRVVNQDTGKSRQDALAELFLVVDKLKTYRKLAPKWLADRRVSPGIYFFKRYYTRQQPFGVAAVIGPWNYPLDLTVPPLFSALLAGNTVVLKPSEVTPAVGALIEDLIQSVPRLAPFVRVLHGDGEVGAALVNARPDVVFLTGSTQTGRAVARATAETMTPFICELGGKDPMIILDDADLKAAARWGVWGAFFHSGQTCVAIERVYVMEQVYKAFVAEVLAEMDRLQQGYSPHVYNPNVLGPVTFERQVDIIKDHLQDAVDKGARILVGGECEGNFIQPTVVVDVNHRMKLMRDETFGPVMPIMKVRDDQEAIRLANDSTYGLSASVWSEDQQRAERVAQELEVGSVVVNDTITHYAVTQLPFGGVKQSGTARTHGKEDILQFTQTHAYAVGRTPDSLDVATRLRHPNNYHLMRAIFHALFGVTWRQRLRAAPDLVEHLGGRSGKATLPEERDGGNGRALALAGALAALIAFIVAALRGRK